MTTFDESTMSAEEFAKRTGEAKPNGEAPPPPPPLEIIRPIEWQGQPVPERRWIVPGWIPHGYVTALYGDGSTGKTQLLQQLLTATAIHQPWIGMQTTPCRAIGIFAEDKPDELHIRQDAINALYGCEHRDLGILELVSRVGHENTMMNFAGSIGEVTTFFEQIFEWAKAFKADLVGIDTAADTFGGNENIRPQVRQYIQGCLGRLAREIGGTVIFTAHPSRAGMTDGTGGNTAWSNTVRSRLWLHYPPAKEDEAPDEDLRILSRRKANYARIGDEIRLRWHEGAFVIDHGIDTRTPGLMGEVERDRAQRVFLDLLDKLAAEGRFPGTSPNTAQYAPTMFAKRPERAGFGKRDFEFAMERLFAAGEITLETYITEHRKPRQRIARANNG